MKRKNKLKSRSGFTLAETLLAILILLLVSSIVAQGIPVARNVYNRVVLGANAQVLLSTTVTALRDELGTAWDVTAGTDNSLTYFSADIGSRSKLWVDTATNTIQIQEYVATDGLNTDTTHSVGSPRALVSEKAATRELRVTYNEATCADGVVTIKGLGVYRDTGEGPLEGPLATLGDGDAGDLVIRPVSIHAEATTPPAGP